MQCFHKAEFSATCQRHYEFLWVSLLVSYKNVLISVSSPYFFPKELWSLQLELALSFSNVKDVLVVLLFEASQRQLIIPGGVAHNFCALLFYQSNIFCRVGKTQITKRAVCISLEQYWKLCGGQRAKQQSYSVIEEKCTVKVHLASLGYSAMWDHWQWSNFEEITGYGVSRSGFACPKQMHVSWGQENKEGKSYTFRTVSLIP